MRFLVCDAGFALQEFDLRVLHLSEKYVADHLAAEVTVARIHQVDGVVHGSDSQHQQVHFVDSEQVSLRFLAIEVDLQLGHLHLVNSKRYLVGLNLFVEFEVV